MKTTASYPADPSAANLNLEHIRQFVEQAPAGIAMFDRDMRYLACSGRWLVDHGLEEESVVGRLLYEILPNISERWKKFHERGMAGEVASAEEDLIVRADGRTAWLRWEMRPWLTSERTVGGIMIMSENVTEKVEALNALRESEMRMRLAQEATNTGIWEWDLRDNRGKWSETMWGLCGLTFGGCQPCYDALVATIHPKDREPVTRAANEAVAIGQNFEVQWRVNLAEGEAERWLVARGSPIPSTSGRPERYIGVLIDITERKRMEEALRASEERLRFCLTGASAGAWQWDIPSRKLMWSPECYELHGLDPKADEPGYEDWLHSIHPDDRASVEKTNLEAVARGASEYKTEYRVVLPSGEVRWLAALGKVGYTPDGNPLRLSGISLDITERKCAQNAARKAEAEERRKREELEAILAAIPTPVLIATDANCVHVVGNPAAYQLYRVPHGTNISKSAPVGKAPANFEIYQNGRRLPPEELPIRKAAAKRSFSMQEIELRFVEGDSKYLLGNALPLSMTREKSAAPSPPSQMSRS